MRDPWLDIVARRLARGRSRRDIIKAMLGLLLGGATGGRNHSSGAAVQMECDSGWESYCTELLGAEQCVDFSSDSLNCGFCRNACPDGTRCVEGSCVGSVDGQPPPDLLSASALCNYGPRESLGDEFLDVVVSNNADFAVSVAHIGSMTGPDQPGFPGFVVPAGERWQGLIPRTVPDGIATPGAVITTSAGVLRLPCGYTDIPFVEQPIRPDIIAEMAGIMTRTLSILESTGVSFDALFVLLHPDVKDLVTYSQLYCWYWDYYRTERPAGEAIVTDIQIAPWTWAGNGQAYEEAAEVTYRQPFVGEGGGDAPPPTEEREAVLHLVQADGIWRWFFGTDSDWLAELPETC